MSPPSVALALLSLSACGGGAPEPATPTATSTSTSTSTATSTSTSTATSKTVNAEPDVLTEAQRARDAARAPIAKAVVGAYPNWNGFFSTLVANFSPDGKRILFGSLRDGVPEVYEGAVAKRADAPRAVTTGPERAIWAAYTPDGKSILYLRDTKGDANHHIYKVSVDGTGLVDLTPGEPMKRGEPIIPRKKTDRIVYDARSNASASQTLIVQPLAGGEPKVVYTAKGPGGLGDVTADGARALFGEGSSPDDQTLVEVDMASGKAHRVFPAEGKKAGLTGASYSLDGSRIFVASDEGAESSVLLSLDAKTGKELARYVNTSPPTAPLTVAVSPKGDRLVVGVEMGNRGEVRVLDAATLKLVREVKVPLGDVHVGTFQPDGKAVSLLVSLPDKPADVYTADITTGEVKPLREDKRPGLESLPPLDVSIETVKAFDGLPIPVNQYLPKDRAGKKLPTIAIFHGGPASSYQVRWSPYARFFLSLGYAVVEPNVRGSTGFGRAYEMADNREKRADWLKDVESVNAWLKSQAWCDPQRVVVWGQSYGGYTTLMALTRQPTLWRAGVDLYGPADMKAFLRTTDAAIRLYFVTEFGDLDKDGPLLDEYSPMRDVGKITAPLFVYAGKNDPRVPLSESDTIVRALRERSVPVEYMVAANEGHTVDRNETKIELLTRTSRFLEDALKGP
jgi:dipeptidyl aminopeptidase/acylaminoacyl peptidase